MTTPRDLPEPEPNIQRKAGHPNVPFADDGEPCCAVDFVYPEATMESDSRADLRDGILSFLRDMMDDSTPLQAGQNMFLLVHLCGKSGCATDAELADKMGISATRLSHVLAELPPEYTGLLRCNRRQRRSSSATSRQ